MWCGVRGDALSGIQLLAERPGRLLQQVPMQSFSGKLIYNTFTPQMASSIVVCSLWTIASQCGCEFKAKFQAPAHVQALLATAQPQCTLLLGCRRSTRQVLERPSVPSRICSDLFLCVWQSSQRSLVSSNLTCIQACLAVRRCAQQHTRTLVMSGKWVMQT
jgi:hypothetical protein